MSHRGHIDSSNSRGRGQHRFRGRGSRGGDHKRQNFGVGRFSMEGVPGGNINRAGLIDRRYTAQPTAEGAEVKEEDSSWSATISEYHPPTRTHYNNQPKEFPQDRRFFCDRCFRGYETAHYYELHLKNHVKCIADGCNFEALPRVVAKHLLTFHALNTGNGNVSKEAIDKWLNARKRNFPSQDVVENKERLKQAKLERGEILENRNQFGKFSITSIDKSKQRTGDIGDGEESGSDPTVSRLEEESAVESKRQRYVGTGELIEKLLAEDIRHERNMLLQCIRHIIRHGPEFGIIDTKQATGTNSDSTDQAG